MATTRQVLNQQARGCLIGMACGEALARPLAGLRSGEVGKRYGEISHYVEVVAEENEPQRLALAGTHGAHTSMALALIDSFLYGLGGPSGLDFARRVTALSFPRNQLLPWGSLRGASSSLIRAVDAHARGENWRLAGVREADGGAMLCAAPLGFMVGDAFDSLIDLVVDVTLAFYREPRSLLAASAFVGMIRHVMNKPNISTKGLTTAALQAAELASHSLRTHHKGVVAGSLGAAEAALSMALGRAEQDPYGDMDCRDSPEELVGMLARIVGTGQSLLTTLSTTARRGGAADLLCPAIGALLGAQHGAADLPLGLVQNLRGHREIEKRVDALMSPEPQPLRPLYDLEMALAEDEGHWREARPTLPPTPTRSQLDLL